MGNSNTKESRSGESPNPPSDPRERRFDARPDTARSRGRINRSDLGGFLNNLQQTSRDRDRDRTDAPFERRETRQEREARRLERDRIARAKERERSINEEHVDGGFLVTLGTYTGPEDFSKPVVRQLQIERRLAPFWRGLDDWSESWAEHQLVAAVRGLPVPAADAPPDPDLLTRPVLADSPAVQNLHSTTLPIGARTLSAASDRSEAAIGPGLPPLAASTQSRSASFKPRAKALAAALSVGSRNASVTDLTPKESLLPSDALINGQPIEVFLYKDAAECPICFLTYPPYLNHTRCCDQPICSECFVQIKRADPHLPEHHPNGEARDPNQGLNPDDPPEMLISEPSACPYCQQPEFGVTYDPPPFRRGLVYATSSSNATCSTAMSSQSSLNSTLPPISPQQSGRRRTHSLSATSPNVITTDRVRPDWATKLAAARAHQARRAAAATALHTAAFLMGGSEQRSILRPARFGRRHTASNGTNTSPADQGIGIITHDSIEPGQRGSSTAIAHRSRRSQMEELEEMMFMEAVRLSLATEEERKRKEEKAARKEAKRIMEEEEGESAPPKVTMGHDALTGDNTSGLTRSTLSRGFTPDTMDDGHAAKSPAAAAPREEISADALPFDAAYSNGNKAAPEEGPADAKGKAVYRGPSEVPGSASSSAASLTVVAGARRSSGHRRQMSTTSLGSSLADSPSGNPGGHGFAGLDDGNLRHGSQSGNDERDTGSEPLFNFRSLAELVGVNIEDGIAEGGEGGTSEPLPAGAALSSLAAVAPSPANGDEDKAEAEMEHVEEPFAGPERGAEAAEAGQEGSGIAKQDSLFLPTVEAKEDEGDEPDDGGGGLPIDPHADGGRSEATGPRKSGSSTTADEARDDGISSTEQLMSTTKSLVTATKETMTTGASLPSHLG